LRPFLFYGSEDNEVCEPRVAIEAPHGVGSKREAPMAAAATNIMPRNMKQPSRLRLGCRSASDRSLESEQITSDLRSVAPADKVLANSIQLFRLLFITFKLSQAGQFAKDPLDQLRNGILKQK
jgi:hypothetical protein